MLMKVNQFEHAVPLTGGSVRTRKSFLTSAVKWLEAYAEHRRQRRNLLSLDDHLLKDIGLSRNDAEQIASKPFRRRLTS
jgi:uncharacterized protein YjiS (DUF1127 family)